MTQQFWSAVLALYFSSGVKCLWFISSIQSIYHLELTAVHLSESVWIKETILSSLCSGMIE